MTMRSGRFLVRTLVLTGILVAAGGSMWAQDGGGQGGGQGSGQAGGRRGFGMGPGGARGTMGTVTAVAADHYTIKSEDGTVYTVHFSANTRMMKGGRGFGPGAGGEAEGLEPDAVTRVFVVETESFRVGAGGIGMVFRRIFEADLDETAGVVEEFERGGLTGDC